MSKVYGNGKRITWWRNVLYGFRNAFRVSKVPSNKPLQFCRWCGRPNPIGD